MSDGSVGLEKSVARHRPTLAAAGRWTAFWTAIVLPFLYLPLLVRGLASAGELWTVLALLVLNAVALWVGRTHGR